MAPPLKHLFSFFVLLVSSSLQVHARESQFFSKVTPYTTNNGVKEADELPQKAEVSSFKQEEEQPRFNQESQNGYGLYGHEVDQVDQFTPTTTNNNYEYENNNNGYENKQNSLSDNSYKENGNNNYGYKPKQFDNFNMPENRNQENGNNYYNNNNYNGHKTEEYSANNMNNNDGYKTEQHSRANNKNNNMYQVEQQGMSDTRYLENGRYYFDANSENSYPNKNGYQSARGTSREYGSTSSRGVEARNQYYNGGGYYGNNKNGNEFRNSMDGYQSNEQNMGNQEEFDP